MSTSTVDPTASSADVLWKSTITGNDATPELASAIEPTEVTAPVASAVDSAPVPASPEPVEPSTLPPGNALPPVNPLLDALDGWTVASWPTATRSTSVASMPSCTVYEPVVTTSICVASVVVLSALPEPS